MRITSVKYIRLDLNLRDPYTIAYETVENACNFILKITTSDQLSGYGCAAPDFVVTNEKPSMVEDAIKNEVIPFLIGKNGFQRAEIMEELKLKIPSMQSTLAMVNIALYDLLSRKAQLPLYQVLGGFRHSIPTSVTIGILNMAETLAQAEEIVRKGFNILKIKGGLNLDEDIARLQAIRNKMAGDIKLRFDANQGYTPSDMLRFIQEADHLNIEILEQPLAVGTVFDHNSGDGVKQIPVMADESLKYLKDAFRIAKNSAIDMINIKIQKVGGIDQAIHINSVSKAAGNEVMIGCIDECQLGISSGLHFALSRPNVHYADLDAHLDFTNDPFTDLFSIKEGIMYPDSSPGLGKISKTIQELFGD